MKLIIVESPSKAKTITNFLSNDYVVIASKGHISDLVKFGKSIEYNNGKFKFNYEITSDHKYIAKEIKNLASKSDTIYLATDEDREGEAIAYRIVCEILGGDYKKYPRIAFHEITKTAILKALENPRIIDMNMVDAQITRRALDRVVGFSLSSLLKKKYPGNLTAGRVQSSVLQLVKDKEDIIENFVSVKYYTFTGLFNFFKNNQEVNIETQLEAYNKTGNVDLGKDKVKDGNITIFKDEKEALEVFNNLNSYKDYKIISLETSSPKQLKPKPPFITSTLQQYMSSTAGFSPTRTMQIAQKLYEGVDMPDGKSGAITYMRTDSLNIAKEAQDKALSYILANFGDKYIPEKPNVYVTKSKGAQEAHEAIRPTHIEYTPEIAKKYLDSDELKVYTAVYERFMASQSVPAEYTTTTLLVGNNNAIFKTTGKITIFPGFFKVAPTMTTEDKPLPEFDFELGLSPRKSIIECKEKQTEPPSRYTEASLIKTMEQLGIGRPSTYASTVGLLTTRQYIKVENKAIHITDKGKDICRYLNVIYPNVLSAKFTYDVEEVLDKIASGEVNWESYLGDFYTNFTNHCKETDSKIQSEKVAIDTGRKCPKCNSPLVERVGRYGKFVSCSNYPKCKFIETNNTEEKKVICKCPNCKKDIVERNGKNGKFFTCTGFPKCKVAFSSPLSDTKCSICGSVGIDVKDKEGNSKFYCLKKNCQNAKPTFVKRKKK